MLATILIGFIITILIFGCYVKFNYRTRNYRISVWHYLMASNESAGNPPEETTRQVDTCEPPKSDKDTFEMSPISSTMDTKDGGMECDAPSPGAKVPKETTEQPKEIENETELPQNQENKENIVDMESQNITTQDINKSDEVIEDENSKVISKPIDSPNETEPNPLLVPVPDEKDFMSPEKNHDDDDEGEWIQVKNSNQKVAKSGKNESGASKGASKEIATDNSPNRELRSTKKKLQKEWENFVNSLSKELQKLMGGYWATEDTERYLDGYPNTKQHLDWNKNLEFYLNQLPSSPNGNFIDIIHEDWMKQYDMLEQHHGYIQWLFPIQEQGLNNSAQPLQKHEIEKLKSNDEVRGRLIKSYELMLDFFGMKLANRDSGNIARSDEYQKQQYRLLNSSFHNYLRITRILKCLGEFDLQHYQAPFCKFVLSEIFENGELKNTLKSCLSYWGKVIKNVEHRKDFYKLADGFVQTDLARNGHSSIVSRELYKYFY